MKEVRLHEYRERNKQYKQNKTIQNNERKIHQSVDGECIKTIV